MLESHGYHRVKYLWSLTLLMACTDAQAHHCPQGKNPNELNVWARDIYYFNNITDRNDAFAFLVGLAGQGMPVAFSELGRTIYAGGKSADEIWADAGDPKHRFFAYDLAHEFCKFNGCGTTGTLQDASSTACPTCSPPPEDAFLHVSDDTTITSSVSGTLTMTGCAPPAAKTVACRVMVSGWAGTYYVYNQNAAAYQTYYKARVEKMTQLAGDPASPHAAQGFFGDAQGDSWQNNYNGNNQWTVKVGGHIRIDEIAGGPRIGLCSSPGTGVVCTTPADMDDATMAAAHTTWTNSWAANNAVYTTAAAALGAFFGVNCANWVLDPRCMQRELASAGVHPEQKTIANMKSEDFLAVHDLIVAITDKPYGWFDYFSNSGMEHSPAGMDANPHNYLTGGGRIGMTRYATFLALREVAGRPGQAFYDPTETIPNGCISGSLSGSACQQWQQYFYPAYGRNVGYPTSAAPVQIATGTPPAGTCISGGTDYTATMTYRIYERAFANGVRVIARGQDGWACESEYGAPGALNVALGGSYRVVREDNTLGAAISTLSLYNAEAVILVPGP